MTAKKKGSAVRRIAKVVDAAFADGQAARRYASDPEFRRSVSKDRRTTLSRFRTVRDALADREKIERTKGAKPPSRTPRAQK